MRDSVCFSQVYILYLFCIPLNHFTDFTVLKCHLSKKPEPCRIISLYICQSILETNKCNPIYVHSVEINAIVG